MNATQLISQNIVSIFERLNISHGMTVALLLIFSSFVVFLVMFGSQDWLDFITYIMPPIISILGAGAVGYMGQEEKT